MHLSPFHFLVFTKINTTLLIALNIPRNVGIHQIIQPSAVILLETNTARNAAWPTIITSRDESHPSVLLGHWSRSRFFFSSLCWSFSYKAVLQIDLIPLWQEIQAERYFLGLSHCAGSSPFVVSALHVLVGLGWWWSSLYTVNAWSFLWLHLRIHTMLTCWSEGEVLQK